MEEALRRKGRIKAWLKKSFVRRLFRLSVRLVVLGLLGGIFFILQHNGIVWFNMPSDKSYPIKGVDVSVHQGHIDWEVLASQNLSFAFIKATEGSSWTDKRFAYNFEAAHKAGLYVGAYHFFSFDSRGASQAQNFIAQVPKATKGQKALPPVVDVEFYGNKSSNPPSKEAVKKELTILLKKLESHYGIKPIIYTTPSLYERYFKEWELEYPLWIRSIFFAPDTLIARAFGMYFKDFAFWQYNPHGVLKGYSGSEKYIDLNAFNGDEETLKAWIKQMKKEARK